MVISCNLKKIYIVVKEKHKNFSKTKIIEPYRKKILIYFKYYCGFNDLNKQKK